MTKPHSTPASRPGQEGDTTPSLRDRLRPLELLGISAVLAVFAGLVTALSTRDWLLAGIVAGAGFVVVLVVMAMLSLSSYEPQRPPIERESEHDAEGGPAAH